MSYCDLHSQIRKNLHSLPPISHISSPLRLLQVASVPTTPIALALLRSSLIKFHKSWMPQVSLSWLRYSFLHHLPSPLVSLRPHSWCCPYLPANSVSASLTGSPPTARLSVLSVIHLCVFSPMPTAYLHPTHVPSQELSGAPNISKWQLGIPTLKTGDTWKSTQSEDQTHCAPPDLFLLLNSLCFQIDSGLLRSQSGSDDLWPLIPGLRAS